MCSLTDHLSSVYQFHLLNKKLYGNTMGTTFETEIYFRPITNSFAPKNKLRKIHGFPEVITNAWDFSEKKTPFNVCGHNDTRTIRSTFLFLFSVKACLHRLCLRFKTSLKTRCFVKRTEFRVILILKSARIGNLLSKDQRVNVNNHHRRKRLYRVRYETSRL